VLTFQVTHPNTFKINQQSKSKAMTKLNNFLETLAVNFAAKKSITQEWNMALIVLILLKISTNIVGVYAGFYYLFSVASRVLPQLAATITSVVLLTFIEFLTVYVLIRAAKMIRTKQAKAGIYASLAALLLYSISFHFATTGLATHASMKVTKQTEILAIDKENTETVNSKIDDLKSELKQEKADINANPQRKLNSRKFVLSDLQLNRITEINTKLENLENQRLIELKELSQSTGLKLKDDHAEMKANASKYWLFTAFIMGIQFIVTISLALLYVAIRKEVEPELMFNESVQDVKIKIAEANRSKLLQDYTQDAHYVILAMNQPYTAQKKQEQKQVKAGGNIAQVLTAKGKQTDVLTDVTQTPVNVHSFGTGVCPHCNTSFEKNSHNQKYCSELHRIEFYENKTGKKLNNLKAKHQ